MSLRNGPVAVFKEHNIRLCYETELAENYEIFTGKLRSDKLESMKPSLPSQNHVF
jgi:hypothetical protein